MSKEELQNLDDRVLAVANRAGEARREEDARSTAQAADAARVSQEEEVRREKARIIAEQKRKAFVKMILRVIGCLLAVAAFLSLLVVPEAVTAVGCTGILIFACTCAIVVDRHIRRGR